MDILSAVLEILERKPLDLVNKMSSHQLVCLETTPRSEFLNINGDVVPRLANYLLNLN